jgi:hypothetical protein
MTQDTPPVSTATTAQGRIFICHAGEDAEVAARVAGGLEERGLRCWIAPRDVPYGNLYADAIVDGIRDCAAVVVMVSAVANDRVFVHREVEWADRQNKRLFAVLLEDVQPARGLALFLSSTQWIDAHRHGVDAAVDSLAAALSAVRGEPASPRVTSTPRRSRAVLLGLAGALSVAVVGAGWWSWSRDTDVATARAPEPPVATPPGEDPGDTALAADPVAFARALIVLAKTGDEERIRSRFTPAQQMLVPPDQWRAMAAQAHAFLPAVEPQVVLQRALPRRAAPAGSTGDAFVVVAERHVDGSYYCDQVLLRGQGGLWAAETYNFWIAVDGRCLGEDDVRAAVARAVTILEAMRDGGPGADELAAPMQRWIATPNGTEALASYRQLLAGWRHGDHFVAAVPLTNVNMFGMPGRYVTVRYAVDRDGSHGNLDATMQQGSDGRWRLAGLFLSPWAG